MEEAKAALVEQVQQLKTHTTNGRVKAEHRADVYESSKDRFPIRVQSIDDSRPSTSHFDSDYYSMPASPHDKPSQESLPTTFVSERAKKFITMKKESQRSTQDLHKRLSNASLKAKQKKEPAPQVPKIPEAYQQQATSSGLRRVPSLSPALAYDPYAAIQSGSAPQTPTNSLRGQFRNGFTLDNSSRHSGLSSQPSNLSSPLAGKSKRTPLGSEAPVAPERQSSRSALASYSAEKLTADVEPSEQSETASEATWEAPPSIISEAPSTEMDSNYRGPWYNQISSWGTAPSPYTSRGPGGTQRSASYTEKNFLFNPAEDEDDFIRKTQSFGRRQR